MSRKFFKDSAVIISAFFGMVYVEGRVIIVQIKAHGVTVSEMGIEWITSIFHINGETATDSTFYDVRDKETKPIEY